MSRAQIERCSKLVSTLPVAEFITYVRRPPSFGRERESVHFKTFEDFAPALTGGGEGGVRELVSWYFEPSQPQRITSRLKTQCSIRFLFTLHASHQTTNCPKTTKSLLIQINIQQNIHKRQTHNF